MSNDDGRSGRSRMALSALILAILPSAGALAQDVTPALAESPLYQSHQIWRNRSTVLSSVTGRSDSLVDYARKCREATGIAVPQFTCGDGVEVPGQGVLPAGSRSNITCDAPNSLNRQCDPGSKFQVLPGRTQDAVAVAHCRKVGLPIAGSTYNDIAVIQYNKANGAVCFYQALANLPGDRVPAPESGGVWADGRQHWISPQGTEAINCTGCHDSGGFIRSNYIAQLRTPPHAMPNVTDGYSNDSSPLKYVGLDFASNRSWSIETSKAPGDTGANCIACHRLAVSNSSGGNLGTAIDFAMRATAATQPSKNPHGPNSPIWMRQGQTFFKAEVHATAQKYRDCAVAFVNSGFNAAPPGCTATPLGAPWPDGGAASAEGRGGSALAAIIAYALDAEVAAASGAGTTTAIVNYLIEE